MTSKKTLLISLVLALLLTGALLPSTAAAQEAITLDQVEIRVWPEFDRPSVLVIYSGSVAGPVEEPLELQFTLPPNVTVNAVAYPDSTTGELLNTESSLDGQTLAFTTPNGGFHVEVYDPALQVDGQGRAYSLSWQSPYPVSALSWEVQQPAGASGMSIIPAADDTGSDQFGLPVYFIHQTGIEAGRAATIVLEYTKPSDALTAAQLGLLDEGTGVGAAQQPPTGSAGAGGWVWYVVGAVLIAAAAAAVYFFVIRRAPLPARAKSSRPSGSKRFCTRCGKPVASGDVYCRHCGAKLK
jgi:hypothetical protein